MSLSALAHTKANIKYIYNINMAWHQPLFACISYFVLHFIHIGYAIFARVRAICERKHPNDAVHVPPPLQRYWLRTVLTTYMNPSSSKDVADMEIKRRNSPASTE